MRLVALFLLAVLAASFVPFLAMQQASALSAITFTNETTITSQHEQFQHVYENGTSSAVFLDTNSTGFYFSDSWDGSTLTSLNSTLTNSTYLVDAHAYISPVDLSRYSLLFDGSTQYALAGVNTVYDVTTEDFWMAGMFKRTSDSGNTEGIVWKRASGATDPGYLVFIGATDTLNARLSDGSSTALATIATSISTGVWYAWAANYDRDGNLTLYQYNLDTGTLASNSAAISSVSGSATNTQTFTVARNSAVSTLFFPGHMDNLIPPQIGQLLTEAQFEAFAESGTIPSGTADLYTFNEGESGATIENVIGSNDLTPQNSPTYSSDVATVSISIDEEYPRLSIYVTGRDSDNSTNGVGKWNLADLSQVDDEYFSSDLAPLDIAQSTSNLYVAAINGTDYGTLFDVSLTRSFGSYTEASIHSGTSGTPAFGIYYDVDEGANAQILYAAANTAAAQLISAGSTLIGKPLNTIVLQLDKTGSPTGDAEVGLLDSSGNIAESCGTIDVSTLTTTEDNFTFFCSGDHTIAANDRIGIRYNAGDISNALNLHYDNTGAISNTVAQAYTASWASISATADLDAKFAHVNSRVIVYDGSPDTRYYFFESGTDGDIRAVKRTGSTTLLATAMDHTVGEPFSVVQLTDRIIIQTATDVYQLLTATDAITEIHPNSFNTRYPQTFEIAPAARTFNSDAVMMANATYAAFLTPNTGATARTGVLIDDVNTGGSGTIEAYDPTKFYYLPENDLTAEATSAGDTSWQVDDIGARDQVQITAYTEALGIDLLENTTAILSEDVVKLVCDNGDYLIEIQYFAVGSDADCNNWKTLDVSSQSTGRMLPYSTSAELVHTSEYTDYTVQLSVADPSVYELTTIYDALDVDTGEFDSGGNTLQYLLLGQCYTLQIVEESTGNTLQTGVICAGNIDPITISLSGIVIPDDWLKTTWSYNIQRNYTDNGLLFTFQKSVSPYNGSLYVTDNFDTAEATFDQWYNFTEVSGASIANITGTTSNMTLYFTLYENGTPVINAVSNAQVEIDNPFSVANFGLLFGVPAAFIFPVLTAAMFPRSLAYFGSIVTVAVIGILSVFGYITLPIWFWAIIMPVLAFAIFVGYKR